MQCQTQTLAWHDWWTISYCIYIYTLCSYTRLQAIYRTSFGIICRDEDLRSKVKTSSLDSWSFGCARMNTLTPSCWNLSQNHSLNISMSQNSRHSPANNGKCTSRRCTSWTRKQLCKLQQLIERLAGGGQMSRTKANINAVKHDKKMWRRRKDTRSEMCLATRTWQRYDSACSFSHITPFCFMRHSRLKMKSTCSHSSLVSVLVFFQFLTQGMSSTGKR